MTRLATSSAILGIFASGMMVGLPAGCSSDQVEIGRGEPGADAAAGAGGATSPGTDATGGGSGGGTGVGGVTGTGGATQLGGSTSVGGATGTGGATQQGGSTGSGGTTSAGGSPGAGGATRTGGAGGSGSGGAGGTADAGAKDAVTRPDSTATCGMLSESCENQPCCGPLVCVTLFGPPSCAESLRPPPDSGTGSPDKPTDAGHDGPTAIITPTLPAPCTTSADCCVAMDICMATAYLVGKAEFDAMVASIESVHVPYSTSCLACVHPAVQVQCQAGFCVGEQLSFYAEGTPFDKSHCGTIDTATSDGGVKSLASARSVTDGGTSPSKWGCAI